MSTRLSLLAGCATLLLCSALLPSKAVAIDYYAAAPGQEKLMAEILGRGASDLPGGCAFESARIMRARIEASYRCEGKAEKVGLLLVHPDSPVETSAVSAKFKVKAEDPAHEALAAAVAARAKEREARWHWMRVLGGEPDGGGVGPTPPSPDAPEGDGVSGEMIQRFQKMVDLFHLGKHAEALELALAVARENPRFAGILGHVVANLAPTEPDDEATAAYAAAADEAKDDPLAQFVAGVAAHYNAHSVATTAKRKKELYAQAITYLSRSRPAFDFAPRIYIYLAVSNYRLGHQKEAEELIEKAIKLNEQDPDAYYCRAEIHHRKDVDRALEDLDRYLEMVSNIRSTVRRRSPTGKLERVKAMKRYLQKVDGGDAKLVEVFDPLDDASAKAALTEANEPAGAAGGRIADAVTSPEAFARLVLVLLALLLLGGAFFTMRRALRGSKNKK